MNGQSKAGRTLRMVFCLLVFLAGLAMPNSQPAKAQPVTLKGITFRDLRFANQWSYSDLAVSENEATRTWLWGPTSPAWGQEPMKGRPGDSHLVQYFDKARMELDSQRGTVTNGLLVLEMMRGEIQVGLGPNDYSTVPPAAVPIAGDAALTQVHPDTPFYGSLYSIATIGGAGAAATPLPVGAPIRATYTRSGAKGNLPSGEVANSLIPTATIFYPPRDPNGHNIPSVFWEFLYRKGTVWEQNRYVADRPLFADWVATVGLPITEPYWARVLIDGKPSWVLFQAFQRRILTYNPSNDPLWRVEMGNVGLHYYEWRQASLQRPSLAGALVVQSSGGETAKVCRNYTGTEYTRDVCPGSEGIVTPRPFATTLEPQSWARTFANGLLVLHSNIAVYDMQASTKLIFKGITNSVDSSHQQSGRVNYMHGSKKRMTIETGVGEITTIGTRFSVIVTDTAKIGEAQLRIIVPSKGGSVTLQPLQGPGQPVPREIIIPGGRTLTVIAGRTPLPGDTQPITPAEEQYWNDRVAALQSIPGLEEIVKESESPGPRLVLAYFQPSFTFDDWKSGGTSATPTVPYESTSPDAINLQLRQAWFAGIDGLVSEWSGAGTPGDQNLGKLLSGAADLLAKGYYTTTLPGPVYPDVKLGINFNMALLASQPDKGASQVRGAISAYAGHPSYLRWGGKPVVFFRDFQSYGDPGRWRQLRDAVDPQRVQLWVADSTDTAWLDVFDGLNLRDGGLRESDSEMFAINKGLRSAIDAYNNNHTTRRLWVASAVPGWDNSKSKIDGKPNPNPRVVDRHSGVKYDTNWCAAVSSSPDWVVINSFNDWYQGTQIEPSPSDCGRYLAITTKWSTLYKAGTSTCEP